MFAAGFADTELQRIIMSGVQDHSLAEDLSVVNNTLTIWSPRSVCLPPPPLVTLTSRSHNTAPIWEPRMLLSY